MKRSIRDLYDSGKDETELESTTSPNEPPSKTAAREPVLDMYSDLLITIHRFLRVKSCLPLRLVSQRWKQSIDDCLLLRRPTIIVSGKKRPIIDPMYRVIVDDNDSISVDPDVLHFHNDTVPSFFRTVIMNNLTEEYMIHILSGAIPSNIDRVVLCQCDLFCSLLNYFEKSEIKELVIVKCNILKENGGDQSNLYEGEIFKQLQSLIIFKSRVECIDRYKSLRLDTFIHDEKKQDSFIRNGATLGKIADKGQDLSHVKDLLIYSPDRIVSTERIYKNLPNSMNELSYGASGAEHVKSKDCDFIDNLTSQYSPSLNRLWINCSFFGFDNSCGSFSIKELIFFNTRMKIDGLLQLLSACPFLEKLSLIGTKVNVSEMVDDKATVLGHSIAIQTLVPQLPYEKKKAIEQLFSDLSIVQINNCHLKEMIIKGSRMDDLSLIILFNCSVTDKMKRLSLTETRVERLTLFGKHNLSDMVRILLESKHFNSLTDLIVNLDDMIPSNIFDGDSEFDCSDNHLLACAPNMPNLKRLYIGFSPISNRPSFRSIPFSLRLVTLENISIDSIYTCLPPHSENLCVMRNILRKIPIADCYGSFVDNYITNFNSMNQKNKNSPSENLHFANSPYRSSLVVEEGDSDEEDSEREDSEEERDEQVSDE